MKTEETRQLVERFLDHRLRSDVEGIRSLLADDAVWHLPVCVPDRAATIEGSGAISMEMTGGNGNRMEGLDPRSVERKVVELIAEGPKAVVLQRLRASTTDGRTYENDYLWIYTCASGRIVDMVEVTDTLLQARFCGWV